MQKAANGLNRTELQLRETSQGSFIALGSLVSFRTSEKKTHVPPPY